MLIGKQCFFLFYCHKVWKDDYDNNILFGKTSSKFQSYNEQIENKEIAKELNVNIETNKITISKNELLNLLGEKGNYEFTPTIDRIDNSKGYTKDNIWIISKMSFN